jgi:shikimate dehydrogenase
VTLSGKARLAGLIGWPVSHSRSPRLHGYWLEHYGIDGAYLPLPVPLVGEGGRLAGSNSDGFGFMANLEANAASWRRDRPAVVLGAGGAARAVVAALQDAGVSPIRLLNRTETRARALAAALGGAVEVLAWEARGQALVGAGLVVNATSLGMSGAPELDIDLAGLAEDAVVNDIVYTPLRTGFLARAEDRGLVTVDGLGMLLHQARPGFAAWFGREPEVSDELRSFVLADLAP